ncbi:MAG: extracellular solute-binding protein, partial [candidate division KSB1 bacterium]|nr:extracellular solute-binding protein [candidate division KSB1 bacterium]
RLRATNGAERWIGIADIRNIWWQRFFDFYSLYLAASGGVTLVRGDSVLFENEAAVGVMAFLQEVYRQGLFPKQKSSAVGDLFLLERIATRFTGPWTISHLERFKPEGFEYAFSPLPVPEKTNGPIYTYGDPKNIVIFSTCKRPQDAWEFIRFMLSRENDRRFLEITSQLPRRVGMTTDSLFADYFRRHPMMAQFARQAHYVRGVDQAPVMKEVFDAISQEYEAAVVYQVKSAEQAIHDAAARVRLILR